jgi:hypothetical protein
MAACLPPAEKKKKANVGDFDTEIERLPGCGVKIARLYQQWTLTGSTDDTRAAETDTEMAVLKMFYEIWGVGDVTARQFYNKGMSAIYQMAPTIC